MNQSKKENNLNSYGGQALIEGILMRGKKYVVAAFREPSGSIHLEEEKLSGIYEKKISEIPFLRGLLVLWDSLYLGMKYLTLSANIQSNDDEKIEGSTLYVTLIISILFSIGLFFILPSILIHMVSQYLALSSAAINFGEGIIRLLILILYLVIIGRSKEISRVFGYHGAEHKTINALENEFEISVECSSIAIL